MTDLAAQLKIIAEHAKLLRDAGITGTVCVGGVEFTLRDDTPAPVTKPAPDEPRGTLDDHVTYGLPEGATLPGFVDPQKART